MEKIVRILFFGSSVLFLAAIWLGEALPEARAVREELLSDPVQRARQMPAFSTNAGGVEYSVQPRFTYDLYGLVVSRHDTSSWWDYIHKEWNDNLNVVDLCVVWGENIRRDAYRSISFSNDQWTCWYETRSSEALQAFDATAASNNHMITESPRIAHALRSVRVGDQVHVRGYLSDYSIITNGHSGIQRVTSTVRNDSGNGACEIVYVEDFEILKAGGGIWRKIKWIAAGVWVISILAWFMLPPRLRR